MAKIPKHTDSEASRELLLFATNDAQLYRSRITPIIENLKKKIKKGTYDKVLALKLWRYAADDAAKRYNKEFTGTTSGYGIFTVPIRNEVSTLLQEYYDEELHYKANPAKRKGINARSQITKRPPSARLKKRRAKNVKQGYFPNPAPRVTQKQLQSLVDRINEAAGTPLTPYEDVNGKYTAQIGNYHIESAYGGHKLSQISNESGGTRDITHLGYVSKRELYDALSSILTGIELSKGGYSQNPIGDFPFYIEAKGASGLWHRIGNFTAKDYAIDAARVIADKRNLTLRVGKK